MIVVVAFMKGFQQKFEEDIVDAQGHARTHSLAGPVNGNGFRLNCLKNKVLIFSLPSETNSCTKERSNQFHWQCVVTSLLSGPPVLPLDEFLANGPVKDAGSCGLGCNPIPSVMR